MVIRVNCSPCRAVFDGRPPRAFALGVVLALAGFEPNASLLATRLLLTIMTTRPVSLDEERGNGSAAQEPGTGTVRASLAPRLGLVSSSRLWRKDKLHVAWVAFTSLTVHLWHCSPPAFPPPRPPPIEEIENDCRPPLAVTELATRHQCHCPCCTPVLSTAANRRDVVHGKPSPSLYLIPLLTCVNAVPRRKCYVPQVIRKRRTPWMLPVDDGDRASLVRK